MQQRTGKPTGGDVQCWFTEHHRLRGLRRTAAAIKRQAVHRVLGEGKAGPRKEHSGGLG